MTKMSFPWKRWVERVGPISVVVGFVIVFIVSVAWFRQPDPVEETTIDSIASILRPDPISQAILNGAIDVESPSASLKLVSNQKIVGQAHRGIKDGHYFLELSASMPEIDREVFYYQVWLVRPIPYDYVPVGEMVTNEEGVFMLAWDGQPEVDYSGYMRLVITRQEYQGSKDPQTHIVRAEFGE